MMSLVDSQFVDVDFEQFKQWQRGSLTRTRIATYANASDVVPIISESEWRHQDELLEEAGGGLERLVTRIFDQGNEGSCVANATAQQHQVMQAAQFGVRRVVQLSAISLYKRIGRSPNSGAMIDDALDEMDERGILPLDTPENRVTFGNHVMPATGFRSPYPSDWERTAAMFTSNERLIVRSVEEMFSCLFRGFPVVVGRAGHSILYLRPKWDGRRWLAKYVNSWADWGEPFGVHRHGFGYDSASLFRESAQWAFAIRSVRVSQSGFNLAV